MEGGLFFRWEGFIFKWGVHPMGRDIGFDGGVSKKIVGWEACPHAPPPHPTLVVRS